jgi:hypothetical protein
MDLEGRHRADLPLGGGTGAGTVRGIRIRVGGYAADSFNLPEYALGVNVWGAVNSLGSVLWRQGPACATASARQTVRAARAEGGRQGALPLKDPGDQGTG